MTTILTQDASNSEQVFDGEVEKHKVHRIISHLVIAVEGFLSSLA